MQYHNRLFLLCLLFSGTILLALASSTSALPPCSCGRFLKPVCGSDDETYVNECRLQCAQQTDPQLTLKHEGPCSGGPNFQSCICPLNYLPVCGTDGNNYPNLCALECEKKKNNLLGLRHKGNCESISRDNKVKRQAFSACTCTRKLKPVCGTDGVTYNNPCLLECAAVSRPDLRISQPVPCDNSVKVVEQPEPELKPECICKRNMKPVCGSDGNTYNNECLLRCAGPSLRVEYDGACVDKVKVATPELNCNCNRDLKPVCGSDGMTYNNDCILRCSGNPVSAVREGPC